MTVVVTGGAGFIGSHIVRALMRKQKGSLLVVDRAQNELRFRAAIGPRPRFVDSEAFLARAEAEGLDGVRAVLHQGARTDTMLTDRDAFRRDNVQYSVRLLSACLDAGVSFLYASSAAVYGTGRRFVEDGSCDAPATDYARSKAVVDRAVREALPRARSQVVGLRYFNVYGPGEAHKGRMASVVLQFYRQLRADGVCRLFGASDGFGPGEQRRDFVWIGDVVAVNLWFLRHPELSGIFNVGTGCSRSFNDVARAVIEAAGGGAVEYFAAPPVLAGRYQSVTEADVSRLRVAGYGWPFVPLEDGVAAYIGGEERAA